MLRSWRWCLDRRVRHSKLRAPEFLSAPRGCGCSHWRWFHLSYWMLQTEKNGHAEKANLQANLLERKRRTLIHACPSLPLPFCISAGRYLILMSDRQLLNHRDVLFFSDTQDPKSNYPTASPCRVRVNFPLPVTARSRRTPCFQHWLHGVVLRVRERRERPFGRHCAATSGAFSRPPVPHSQPGAWTYLSPNTVIPRTKKETHARAHLPGPIAGMRPDGGSASRLCPKPRILHGSRVRCRGLRQRVTPFLPPIRADHSRGKGSGRFYTTTGPLVGERGRATLVETARGLNDTQRDTLLRSRLH